MALYGAEGRKARRGALALAALCLAHRPTMPNIILDEED